MKTSNKSITNNHQSIIHDDLLMVLNQSFHRSSEYLSHVKSFQFCCLMQFVFIIPGDTSYSMNRQVLSLILHNVMLEEQTEIVDYQLAQ